MVQSRDQGRSTGPHSEVVSSEGDSTYVKLASALATRLVLGHKLGEGGMGAVYAATHPEQGAVVVKLMHAHIDATHAERFRLEGQTLARLRSPHVVRIVDWGIVGEQPYLVMERLEGQDLGKLLEEGKLPLLEAIRIAKDVLRGLAVVHENKIVHRDIKPGNIFVCRGGGRRAVLLDFGVAKLLERITGIDPLRNATKTGSTVGTPRYISPEQASAKPVDHRADLYSFAVVFFSMLTGERLFPARTLSALLLAHCKEPPRPPSSLVPSIPATLDAVVLRALAKRPDDRFADAAAFLAALEEVERSLPAPTAMNGATQILPEDWEEPVAPSATRRIVRPAGSVAAVTQQVVTRPMPRQPDVVAPTRPMAQQAAPIAPTVIEEASPRGPAPMMVPTAPMVVEPLATTEPRGAAPASRSPSLVIIVLAALGGFVVAVVLTLALTGGGR